MQEAIRDYQWGKFPTIRKTAAHHGVDFTTLSRRLKGAKEARLAHPESSLLTPAQEEAIVQLCLRFDSWGLPLKFAYVKALAHHMQDPEKRRQPGQHWMARFLDRHPTLARKIASRIDWQRAWADDQKALAEFFHRYFPPPK